jgi:hypothetical protein
MGISVIGAAASSGGGGGGDFVINTGDYSSDTAELSTEFAAGAYSITVSPTDSTLDIYLVASDGSFAGYTNTGSITATIPFNKVVVLGSTASTSLSFIFNGESQTATTKGQLGTAGAFVSSVVTSSLPSVDDTTVLNGGNFAADVEVSFIDQSSVETAAKTVVRSSSTQLIVTRPDSFSTANSPFTVKVVNPGIPIPSSSNAHLLANSVTAGTNPVWTTGTAVYFSIDGATNYTFLATDTEASDIDYSVVSGTLPAGLTLDGETGVISGTFSGSASEGDVASSATIRAIDAGGNFLDKAFNFTANSSPIWTTAAGALDAPVPNTAYSLQFAASGGATGGALTYTLQSGALLAGHSLSSTGLISGTSTDGAGDTAAFTVRVADEGTSFADRSFTMEIATPVSATGGTVTTSSGFKYHTFTSGGTFTVNSGTAPIDYLVVAGGGGGGDGNPQGGGGGAGEVISGTAPISVATHSITIGAGGAKGGSDAAGYNGYDTSLGSFATARGGGRGAGYNGYANTGGSGGGGAGPSRNNNGGSFGSAGIFPAGGISHRNSGANWNTTGGGGGGAGAAASYSNGGAGFFSSISGSSQEYGRGGQGGVGGNDSGTPAVTYGGGGGGSADSPPHGQDGNAGIVIIRYAV